MSSIAVSHQSASPAPGETHDLLSVRVHRSNVKEQIRDSSSRGWALVTDERIWIEKPMPSGIGGVPTDFHQLTFARTKYPIGTFLLWNRPTLESDSPTQTLPSIVMGQFADGPYQLFVCSFQGAHIQTAPPEQLVPMPERAAELLQAVGRDLVALKKGYDVATRAGILYEERMARLEARIEALEALEVQLEKGYEDAIKELEVRMEKRLEALESAATTPHKGKKD